MFGFSPCPLAPASPAIISIGSFFSGALVGAILAIVVMYCMFGTNRTKNTKPTSKMRRQVVGSDGERGDDQQTGSDDYRGQSSEVYTSSPRILDGSPNEVVFFKVRPDESP
jgi:hypothetical protein